jgi:hypothetical protein
MKNTLWYMGFLSALSLMYFINGKVGFLGFLGFLPYFTTYSVSDERLEKNLGKATRTAFAYTIVFGVSTIVYISLTDKVEYFAPAFIMLFGGSLLVCLISLLYYDRVAR